MGGAQASRIMPTLALPDKRDSLLSGKGMEEHINTVEIT
jgi:hypothetical protein